MTAPWWLAQHEALHAAAGVSPGEVLPHQNASRVVLARETGPWPADLDSWRWIRHPEADPYRPLPTRGQQIVERFRALPLVSQVGVTREGRGTGALLAKPLYLACTLAGLFRSDGDPAPFITWLLALPRAELDRVLFVRRLVSGPGAAAWKEGHAAGGALLRAMGAPMPPRRVPAAQPGTP